ncbi:hypothetical protein YC68_23750, partial [Vibrio parahaemolyticus]
SRLNENGSYSGKASVIFERHTDARKALLLYDGKQIDGRKLKMKLFVNGERLYPNHVTLPNPPGTFKVDWVNPPPTNMVVLPSVKCMMELVSQYSTNFFCQKV